MRKQFWDEGYCLIPRLFSRDEMISLRHDVQEIFGRQILRLGLARDREAVFADFETPMFELFERAPELYLNCGKQAQHLISLHRLSLDARILKLIGDLGLDSPCVSTRPVLFFHHERTAKHDSYWKVPAHQDWSSMQGSADSVVAWLPMVDVDEANGALQIVPRSHLAGLRPSTLVAGGFGELALEALASHEAFQAVPMASGDALLFSSMLIHRSGHNRTGRFRWSCNFRYNNLADPTFIARGYPHAYLYRPVSEILTPEFDTQAAVEAVRRRQDPPA